MSSTKSKKSAFVISPLFERIQDVFNNRIRPFVQMDGGDVELVELTPEKVLKIRLQGACIGCGAIGMTYEMGVQQILFDEFPDEDIQILMIQNE